MFEFELDETDVQLAENHMYTWTLLMMRGDWTNQDILQWAASNITLYPGQVCRGSYPLPIELIDGTWLAFRRDVAPCTTEVAATLDYAVADHLWTWRVGATVGCAASLLHAKEAAEIYLGTFAQKSEVLL